MQTRADQPSSSRKAALESLRLLGVGSDGKAPNGALSNTALLVDAPVRYVLYARKSTESEDRQVQSIEDQTRLCREKAQREELLVSHTLTEARSARYHGKRTGFQEMVALIEKGEADGILAWHPDRLARNAVDGGLILDLLDRGKLRDLRFVTYTFENTPEGKFMLGMLLSKSKYDVDKLSVDVKRGLDSKRANGVWPHKAPVGYRNNRAERTIEADPERLPLLRLAVELVLAGTHLPTQALKILNEQWGYRTPATKRHGSGPLSRSAFYDLLSNPFYCGICRERHCVYKGSHPPLMTVREFEALQRILERPFSTRAKRYVFALTGLIRCGRCGCMVTATLSKGHVYYHCSNSRGVCDRRGVRGEMLEGQVTDLLERFTIPEWAEPLLLQAVQRFVDEHYGREAEITAALERAIEAVQRDQQELLAMRMRGLITDGEYLTEKGKLQGEAERLRRETNADGGERERVLETATNVLAFATRARRAFVGSPPEEKRRLAELMGANHVLTGGKLLLELDPCLTVFTNISESSEIFKPVEIGSEKPKRTIRRRTVLSGRGEEIALQLCEVIRRLQEPFPALDWPEPSTQ